MNQLAQPAPKFEAVSAEKAPKVEAATTDSAQVVEPATVEQAQAVLPALLFDPKRDAPQLKEVVTEKGISVKALRGTTGADFESVVALLRGAPKKNFLKKVLPLFFDERDFVSFGEVKRFVVIKGDCCFVFTEETEIQPLYAIPLDEVRPVMEDSKKPDKNSVTISPTSANATNVDFVTVLLKYHNGSQAYQFTFDTSKDRSVAKRFYDVVKNASKAKSKTVTASVLQAKNVGKEAAKAQPNDDIRG